MPLTSLKRFRSLTLTSLSATVMLASFMSTTVNAQPIQHSPGNSANAAISNVKVFSKVRLQTSGNQVTITLHADDVISLNDDALYLETSDNQPFHLALDRNHFSILGPAPEQPGTFNVPIATGHVKVSGNRYKVSFSWPDVLEHAN